MRRRERGEKKGKRGGGGKRGIMYEGRGKGEGGS